MSNTNERAALKAIIFRLIAEAMMEKKEENKETLASSDDVPIDEEEINEFSSAGAIAGPTLPLGMAPARFPNSKNRGIKNK